METICTFQTRIYTVQARKTLGETQTLRAGCSKAEPKIFAPPQSPFPAKIEPTGDGHYLHLQTQFGEDRCT